MHEIDSSTLKSLGKCRAWWAIGYLDGDWSLPDNFLNILEDTHIPCFVSPLHEFDINVDGTPKKPHYHIMLMFDNTTTATHPYHILHDLLHCATFGHQLKCFSTKGCARYLIHWDNADKFQYDMSQVITLNGADYELTCEMIYDWVLVSREILEFIQTNSVCTYADLVLYCSRFNISWYKCVATHTIFFKEFIRSGSWRERVILDTGDEIGRKLLAQQKINDVVDIPVFDV